MGNNQFFILDVFAEEKYSGNQLAVVMVECDLSDPEMQQIAREFNYSETTFILAQTMVNGGFAVRIFTPEKEIPFAGHPTLGTAFVIQREIIKEQVTSVFLNVKIGQIPVTLDYKGEAIQRLTMKQIEPEFGKIFEIDEISGVLQVENSDIDNSFPIEEVSTGLPFIIVPLKTLDAVKKAKIHKDAYCSLIKDEEAKALFLFCPETYNKENHLNARMFADYYGIPEDPATGSANGCLAGYLVKHRYFGKDRINIRVEQGYEIGRPSLIFLDAKRNGEAIDVHVGGKVIEIARGILV